MKLIKNASPEEIRDYRIALIHKEIAKEKKALEYAKDFTIALSDDEIDSYYEDAYLSYLTFMLEAKKLGSKEYAKNQKDFGVSLQYDFDDLRCLVIEDYIKTIV